MKILYIGSHGALSYYPLKALLNQGFEVCAVAFDDSPKSRNSFSNISIIEVGAQTIQTLASTHNVPIIPLPNDFSKSLNCLHSLQPDLIIVSCYARILPAEITSIPKLGCYNIHPSLLPTYPGPDPLFWQLREGEQNWGISIHRVSDIVDGGDILIQQPLHLPNGLSKHGIDKTVAIASAELLITALQDFEYYQRKEFTQKILSADSPAAYRSFAKLSDVNLSSDWSAQRLYNFICAYSAAGIYFNCLVNQKIFRIERAIHFDSGKKLDAPYFIENNKITFACLPGLIKCQLSEYHL